MGTCTHPKEALKHWHDSAVLCTDCKCIISQYGEVFDKPYPLYEPFPPTASPACSISPSLPRVIGVGRDTDDETGRTLLVFLDREPSDDELRKLHDAWRN